MKIRKGSHMSLLTKLLQSLWTNHCLLLRSKSSGLYGEEKYVVTISGLRVEMASLKIVGHWLDKIGWDSALVQTDIRTGESEDGILTAVHIIRSPYANQASACAPYILQRKAYKEYTEIRDSYEIEIDFKSWIRTKSDHHPQLPALCNSTRALTCYFRICQVHQRGELSPLCWNSWNPNTLDVFPRLDLLSRWLPVQIRDLKILKKAAPLSVCWVCWVEDCGCDNGAILLSDRFKP